MRGKELGQYFTPRSIVKLMTRMAALKVSKNHVDKVADACCGTGGFLIEALTELRNTVRANRSLSVDAKEKLIDKICNESLYGVDFGKAPPVARIARINMYLHGDGGSRIYFADSLDKVMETVPGQEPELTRDQEELKNAIEGGLRFQCVLTNPPFSMTKELKNETEARILRQYGLARIEGTSRFRSSLRSNSMFMERYRDLLVEGGRLLTVIDDGLLAGDDFSHVRYFASQALLMPELIAANRRKLTTVLADSEAEIEPELETKVRDIKNSISGVNSWVNSVMMIFGNEDDLYRRLFQYALYRPELIGKKDDVAREILLDDWFESRWYDLFPLSYAAIESGLYLVILNSIDRDLATIGESALGSFGSDQLLRLAEGIDSLPSWTRTVVILAHHPCFRRPGEWRLPIPRPLFQVTGWRTALRRVFELALLTHEGDQARELVTLLSRAADNRREIDFFLLSGHRHAKAAGQAGRVTMLEGSSLSESGASAWAVFPTRKGPSLHEYVV
jgi:hypothetical protein